MNILNSSEKCQGKITRERKTCERVEKSIIDFIIVFVELEDFLDKMIIDDERKLVLTKFSHTKNGLKKTESDHNILFAQFDILCNTKSNKIRRQIFNFKNKKSIEDFKHISNITDKFNDCFNKSRSFEKSCNRFYRRIEGLFHQTFKKVRVGGGENSGQI